MLLLLLLLLGEDGAVDAAGLLWIVGGARVNPFPVLPSIDDGRPLLGTILLIELFSSAKLFPRKFESESESWF